MESLGYVAPGALAVVEKFPPYRCPAKKPTDPKPPDPRTKLLNTLVAVVEGLVSPPEYERLDSNAKAAEPSKDWSEMVDLSDIDEEAYRKQVLSMLERHEKLCSGHLGEIKGVSHRIELQPGTRPIRQQMYRAGPQGLALVGEHVNKMLAAEVIEPDQRDWASLIVIVPKKDGTTRFCVDYRQLNEGTIPDSYPIPRMDDRIDSLGNSTVYSALDAN